MNYILQFKIDKIFSHDVINTIQLIFCVSNLSPKFDLVFLGGFAKLQKATISCVLSVCPSATIRLTQEGF